VNRFTGVKSLTGQNRQRYVPLANRKGIQYTESESHPWDGSHNRPRSVGDIGGPFFTQKFSIQAVDPSDKSASGVYDPGIGNPILASDYIGPILAVDPGIVEIPVANNRGKTPLEAMGATAIARVKPTNSMANVATALAELYSEGLPKLAGSALWKEKTLTAKAAGEEYLNVEFGWKPTLSDITDVVGSIKSARDWIKNLERLSHGVVRRRYDFPVEETNKLAEVVFGNTDPACPPGLANCLDVGMPGGAVYRDTKTYRKVWFSGAFTFHLPRGYKSHNKLIRLGAQADALLGLDITPDVIWNAAPWSWAVDWFSNAGEVISNFSDWSTDGLVLKYGYIMEHSFVTYRYYKTDNRRLRAVNRNVFPSPVIVSVETKQRLEATPFGFGLDWSSFTARQLAITAALGLTKK